MTKSELEALLRSIIKNRDEYEKVDQKSSYDFNKKRDRARLVKLISAIANTDDTRLDNIGYIILGATKGALIGGADYLKNDAMSANMQAWTGEYIEPLIIFSIERFYDSQVGWWGAIKIAASTETHVFKKEFKDHSLSIRKGDIYVRHGDSTALAEKIDLDRLQRRKFRNDLDRLEKEVSELRKVINTRKPDLRVFFFDNQNNWHETIEVNPIIWEKSPEQITEEKANDAKIEEIETLLRDYKTTFLTTKNVRALTNSNEKLRNELHKRKALKHEYWLSDPVVARTIELRFILSNNGDIMAEGVHFYLYFPTNLKLSIDSTSFRSQEPPNLKFQQIFPSIAKIISASHSTPNLPESMPKPDFVSPKYGGPEIEEQENGLCVKYWIEKLIQNHKQIFSSIYLLSPADIRDINIAYSIYAENVPGKMEGSLQLRIRPKGRE